MASTNPALYGQNAQRDVKKGMTKDQVSEILGSPHATRSRNGVEIWLYQKNNSLKALVPGGFGGTETNIVTVRFNSSGRVIGVDNEGRSQRWGTY